MQRSQQAVASLGPHADSLGRLSRRSGQTQGETELCGSKAGGHLYLTCPTCTIIPV